MPCLEAARVGVAAFAPPGSSVTVVSDTLRPRDVRRFNTRACRFRVLRGEACSRADLLRAGVDRATSVVLVMPYQLGTNEQRLQKTACVLLLMREMRAEGGFPRHAVAEVQGADAETLCRRAAGELQVDVLDTDLVVAGSLLADIVSPLNTQVLAQLLTPAGHEIYIKPADHYLPTGGAPLTGWQAAGLVRARGNDVLLGYVGDDGELHLNPPKAAARAWAATDRLVVLSEQPGQ